MTIPSYNGQYGGNDLLWSGGLHYATRYFIINISYAVFDIIQVLHDKSRHTSTFGV